MTLDELNAINTTDPAQVKRLQEALRARGYYTGPIDGEWGGGTTTGAGKLRDELTQHEQRQENIATSNAKQNDPGNRALNLAVDVGPYAAGAVGGGLWGYGKASRMDTADAAQRASVKELAANREIGPTVAKAEMDSLRGARNWRTGVQFGTPAAALASAEFLRRYVSPNFDPETQKWINLGANADQGLGFGLLLHQLADLPNRLGSPNDPVDSGLINSRAQTAAEPAPPPDTAAPAKPAPKPGSKAALYQEAKARGLPVTTKTKLGDLEKTLAQAMKANAKRLASKAPKAIVPLSVGAGVYDAMRNPAAASDGSQPEPASVPEAAAAGTGAAAATSFGLQRLKDAIMGTRAGSIALRGLGRVAGPVGVGLTAYDVGSGVNDLAHLSPPLPDSEGSTMYGFEPQTPSPMQQQPSQPGGDMPAMTDDEVARGKAWLAQNMPDALGSDQTAPAPGNQSYPLSGQMPDAAGQDQQAVMDSLANLGASDPEIAQMIRDLIQARVSQSAPAPAQ